ncbi:MAG: hypothetical protein IKW57_02925 [Alphaproteobacteria bacterium]|nr:hypothetical protein [Alphaproteobacteria bacterium]
MMKKLITLFGIFACTFAFAETETTTHTVSERQTCSEIQNKISELSAISEPDTETIDELTALKSKYRRTCTTTAGSRRSSASSRIVINQTETDTTETADTEAVETEIVAESDTETETIITTPELTPEQELANLDAGLCADGSKPNKFGCCGDELFKDLGNTVFACCPRDGGDCFPPLN